MDLSTYDGLQAAIADFTARADITSQIPAFIRMAEAKFARALRTVEMDRLATLTTAADGTAALPADFVEVRTVNTLGETGMDLCFIPADVAAIRNSQGGGPVVYGYTLSGGSLGVVPAGVGSVSLLYTAKFVPLSTQAETNWLLANHPDAYLYGTLAEYAAFNQADDPSAAQTWGGQAVAIIQDVQTADRRKRFGAGRVLPPSVAP